METILYDASFSINVAISCFSPKVPKSINFRRWFLKIGLQEIGNFHSDDLVVMTGVTICNNHSYRAVISNMDYIHIVPH